LAEGLCYKIYRIRNDSCRKMKIVAFVGASDSGKTHLIARIITELVRRGVRVAALKHCAHGFEIDSKGKDSWVLARAGAEGVGMIGPGEWAVLHKTSDGSEADPLDLAGRLFPQAEVVLVEGGKRLPGLPKIEVSRGRNPVGSVTPAGQLVGLVTDRPDEAGVSVPVFSFSQIGGICDFILSRGEVVMSTVKLEVDGEEILLNEFVQRIFENTIVGMAASLSGIDPDPKTITLVVERKTPAPKD
jgi:molybdopterin-guanine dinucleotide biosynthesis protein B